MWECPNCTNENDLDAGVEEGQILECLDCGSEFEVTKLDPLTMEELDVPAVDDADVAADDEEDWGDD
jgi:lysine biosynthesis protein LysW